jgi:hypothetical protein
VHIQLQAQSLQLLAAQWQQGQQQAAASALACVRWQSLVTQHLCVLPCPVQLSAEAL